MLSDDLSESKSSIKVILSGIDGIIGMLLAVIISVSFYRGNARHLHQLSKVTEINYLQKYIDFPIYFRIPFYYDWSLLHHQGVSAELRLGKNKMDITFTTKTYMLDDLVFSF